MKSPGVKVATILLLLAALLALPIRSLFDEGLPSGGHAASTSLCSVDVDFHFAATKDSSSRALAGDLPSLSFKLIAPRQGTPAARAIVSDAVEHFVPGRRPGRAPPTANS